MNPDIIIDTENNVTIFVNNEETKDPENNLWILSRCFGNDDYIVKVNISVSDDQEKLKELIKEQVNFNTKYSIDYFEIKRIKII